MAIPIPVKMTNNAGLVSAPWIKFFNSVFNRYNSELAEQLASKATANVYALPATSSGSVIDNYGCGAIQTVNLPIAVTGLEYRIICSVNHAIHMKPQTGEWIDGASATGKYFSLDGTGSSAYLICVNFGRWHVLSSYGANSFEA